MLQGDQDKPLQETMSQRDDFSEAVKRSLAQRVGYLCSDPSCRASTSGPHTEPNKAVNIGVAAHITGAAPNGPRHDAALTEEQRASAENGIWLCQNHGKLVDNDEERFPVALLRAWKVQAEEEAASRLGKVPSELPSLQYASEVSETRNVVILRETSLAEDHAEKLNRAFKNQPCTTHIMEARAIAEGSNSLDADVFVECCCAEFASEIRESLREAGHRLAVHPTLLTPASSPSRPLCLEDLRRRAKVSWPELGGEVVVENTTWFGTSLILVEYRNESGERGTTFLDRSREKSLTLTDRGFLLYAFRRNPGGPPPLFPDPHKLFGMLAKLRDGNMLEAFVEAYVREIWGRLKRTLESETCPSDLSLMWKLLSCVPQLNVKFRDLEQMTVPNVLKVAIVPDPEVDENMFDAFAERIRGSSVKAWFRVSDLTLASRFSETLAKLQAHARVLIGRPYADQLELVEFGLAAEHPTWEASPDLPHTYRGGPDEVTGEIVDPVFFFDLKNVGTEEARIDRAYATIRHRQINPHGFSDGTRLSPVDAINIPINCGEEGYHEVTLGAPILVSPGRHVRVLVRLEDSGWCWRAIAEVGFRYGQQKVVRTPELTLLL